MAPMNSTSLSQKLPWLVGAAATLAAAFVLWTQLSSAPKHRHRLVDAESTSAAEAPARPRAAAAGPNETARSEVAPPPRVPASALPRNMDAQAFINDRYPNQATLAPTLAPPFTAADKERVAREMFPDYRELQEGVEAERKRAGLAP